MGYALQSPMRRTLIAAVMVLAGTASAPGQDAAPTGVPQRIVMNITTSPATSVALTWRMTGTHADAVVQYAVAEGGTSFVERATPVAAVLERSVTEKGREVLHYSATLTALTPAMRYAYRVGREGAWSEWTQFTTTAAAESPLTFVWFGDPQDDLVSLCTRVFREAFRVAPDAAFWLFSGDLTSDAEDRQYGDLFTATGPMFGMLPMAMTPGNHDMAFLMKDGEIVKNEKGKKERTKTISPLWRAHYTLPQNGPAGFEETSYTFDAQGIRFVLINSNDRLPEQAAWLDRVLTVNPNRWTIVAFHHPFYSSGRERDDRDTREAFQAVIERHRVDLVLAGHDHTYARSHPLRADAVVPPGERGTVYANSVSGPKFYVYTPTYRHLMAKTAENAQLFQVIRVDGPRLDYKAFTAAGALVDSFSLER